MPGRQAVPRTGGRLFVREPQASTSTPGAELDRWALTRHALIPVSPAPGFGDLQWQIPTHRKPAMFRKLFVPVDASAASLRAMLASVDLARQLGAAITGFVVEPDLPLPTMVGAMQAYEQASTRHIERTDAHARDILTRFEGLATEAGVAFNGLHARTDDLDRAIVDPAESSGCDMIIMLTHGRGVFGELLFGSHTKQVLASCKLPLLVLH
jgi:nucleotide-binding universal stress UspA family protein